MRYQIFVENIQIKLKRQRIISTAPDLANSGQPAAFHKADPLCRPHHPFIAGPGLQAEILNPFLKMVLNPGGKSLGAEAFSPVAAVQDANSEGMENFLPRLDIVLPIVVLIQKVGIYLANVVSIRRIDMQAPAVAALRLLQMFFLLPAVAVCVETVERLLWRVPVAPGSFYGHIIDHILDVRFFHIPQDDVTVLNLHGAPPRFSLSFPGTRKDIPDHPDAQAVGHP